VLGPVVALLLLGFPFLHLRVGSGDATALPPGAESRRADELLRRKFPGGDVNRIIVVLDAGRGSPRAPERVAQAFALSRWLGALPHVSRVDSFVDLDPSLDLATYQAIAALPREQRPPPLEAALERLVASTPPCSSSPPRCGRPATRRASSCERSGMRTRPSTARC